jgi:hypothetical protein
MMSSSSRISRRLTNLSTSEARVKATTQSGMPTQGDRAGRRRKRPNVAAAEPSALIASSLAAGEEVVPPPARG